MIRTMTKSDENKVLEMMRVFYSSPAVLSNGSEEIFRADIANCVGDSPFLEGYIFEKDGNICGYAMVAKSFSTEFGKPCVFIEDIYVSPDCRGLGLGKQFLNFIDEKYPGCVRRLEVEPENARAYRLYIGCGYEVLPYTEMKKE